MLSRLRRILLCFVLAALVCLGLLKFGPGRSSGTDASTQTAAASGGSTSSNIDPSTMVQKFEAGAR